MNPSLGHTFEGRRVRLSHSEELWQRIDRRISAWAIAVERFTETDTSILAFGRRGNDRVVAKFIRDCRSEWRSGEVLRAFDGNGMVRVYDYVDGAMLLECLTPGTPLAVIAASGNDEQATEVLAEVIAMMSPRPPVVPVPGVRAWAAGFERIAPKGELPIPERLFSEAHAAYLRLCDSQSRPRLLHGDLHHDNVLFDSRRGWLAIDPKGVVGELEFEIGAILRNPSEKPELFTSASTIGKRLKRFERELSLDGQRILAWAFAQCVLCAIWAIEDGVSVAPDNAWFKLANAIRPMLQAGA